MIISSELTGKTYETVEDCLKAEEEFHRQKAEEQKAKEEHDKMLDEAYEEAMAACDKYLKLAGVRISGSSGTPQVINSVDDLLEELFGSFCKAL